MYTFLKGAIDTIERVLLTTGHDIMNTKLYYVYLGHRCLLYCEICNLRSTIIVSPNALSSRVMSRKANSSNHSRALGFWKYDT